MQSELERENEDLRDQLEELQCGERQQPEGSVTLRGLPTIQEEDSESVSNSNDSSNNQNTSNITEVKTTLLETTESREGACVGLNKKDDFEQLECKLENLQLDNKDLLETKLMLNDEVNALKSEKSFVDDKLLKLNNEIHILKEELEEKESKLQQFKSKLEKLQNVEAESASLRSNNTNLTQQLNDIQNIYRDSDSVIAEKIKLEKENEMLKRKLEEMDKEEQAFQLFRKMNDQKLLEMQEEIDGKDYQIKYLEDKIETIKSHNITKVYSQDENDRLIFITLFLSFILLL